MAPVILGFDLGEMSWSAFSSKKMFTKKYTLRRERFIIYQLAMLICLAAECTATYSLAKYEDLQTHIESYSGGRAEVHNDDLIAAECLTIVFSVFVATLFGADFFFLLFFPKRRYPRWYNATKKGLAIAITIGLFTAALMSTIVVARNSAFITGVSAVEAQAYTDLYFRPPLEYKKWAVNVAYVVVLWIGLVFTIASTALMLIATDHDERVGPESISYERRRSEKVPNAPYAQANDVVPSSPSDTTTTNGVEVSQPHVSRAPQTV